MLHEEPGTRRGMHAIQATSSDAKVSTSDPEVYPETGCRVIAACTVAGITLQQAGYWAHIGLAGPSVRLIDDSGRQLAHLYNLRDILLLTVVKGLLEAGIPLDLVWHEVKIRLSKLPGAGTGEDFSPVAVQLAPLATHMSGGTSPMK
jgi:hypothetical protein